MSHVLIKIPPLFGSILISQQYQFQGLIDPKILVYTHLRVGLHRRSLLLYVFVSIDGPAVDGS